MASLLEKVNACVSAFTDYKARNKTAIASVLPENFVSNTQTALSNIGDNITTIKQAAAQDNTLLNATAELLNKVALRTTDLKYGYDMLVGAQPIVTEWKVSDLSFTNPGEKLSDLRASVDNISTAIGALNVFKDSATTDIANNATAIATVGSRLDSTLAGIDADVDNLQAVLETLNTSVAGDMATQLAAVKTRVTTTESDIAALKVVDTTITENVTAANTAIATVNTALDAAKVRVTALENYKAENTIAVSDLVTGLASTNETLGTVNTAVTKNTTAITALKAADETLTASISSTDTTVASISTTVANNSGAITALNGKFAINTDNITALTQTVATNKLNIEGAVETLTGTVTTQGNDITSLKQSSALHTTAISDLGTRVTDAEIGIADLELATGTLGAGGALNTWMTTINEWKTATTATVQNNSTEIFSLHQDMNDTVTRAMNSEEEIVNIKARLTTDELNISNQGSSITELSTAFDQFLTDMTTAVAAV